MFGKSSLKLRLALSIGTLAVLSAVVMSQLGSRFSRDQIQRDQSALLQNIAIRMTSQLAHDMSTRANEIQFLAGLDSIRDAGTALERKREIFERTRQAYPFYAWIGMADAQGNIVAGTDGLLVGKSVAQRDWFLDGRKGLHFGDAHDAFLLAKLMPKPKWDDLPLRLVDVSAPVLDADGKLIGVICGHLSLDWAFEARDLMLDQLTRDALDVVVLNKDGKVLMGTPQLPSLAVDLSGLDSYRELASNPRAVAVDVWPDGQRYLTAAVRETSFRSYPGMGWAVVARKSEKAAFGPADKVSYLIILGGLGTAVLFALTLWITLNRTLRPLEDISAAARRVRDDDANVDIPQLQGQDEVAVFAQSLTSLVNSLQRKNQALLLAERVFEESGQGILISDASNHVLRVNKSFTRITGYELDEVVGKTPAVLRSGQQNAEFYRGMWESIQRCGMWQGEICNRTKAGYIYPEWLTINTLKDESGAITHYIGIFDDITEKKEYERRLVHLANYDALTDLPNRNLLQRQVDAMLDASAEDGRLALMFVDLDKFKLINDTLGHPAGDLVLREVASRIRAHVSGSNLLARWGGDEFVVALPGADNVVAAEMAKKLVESMRRPFVIDGNNYHISLSIGIALCPADGHSVGNLLRCADTAMYQAKQEGSNLYRFYEASMNAGVERFLRIDNALRNTLERGGQGLAMAYQPQFSADGATIVGMEALIRWKHAELGQISPADFIPVAEEAGQIITLGRWIIEAALRDYALLLKSGATSIPLSINCSARQLGEGSLVGTLRAAILKHGLPAEQIMVEVTESAIISDEFQAMLTLQGLRDLGCRISIDDFGTGYSCLNYLQKIHPSEIKVDQSFVRKMLTDPDSRNIVAFTLNLASSMDIEVVAEGVETEEQRAALQAMGPVKLQGFLLGRPMPIEQVESLLKPV